MRSIKQLSLINRDAGYSKQSYNPAKRHNRGLIPASTYGSLALKEDSSNLSFSELLEMEFANKPQSNEPSSSMEEAALQNLKGLWA
jgi:hypothetical protein